MISINNYYSYEAKLIVLIILIFFNSNYIYIMFKFKENLLKQYGIYSINI